MIETFGRRLKRLREGEGLSQTQVASLIGVDQSTMCSYENDRRQPPIATLINLASIFRVTTDYLLGVEKERPIDLGNLTSKDIEMVKGLVDLLAEGNIAKSTLRQIRRTDELWNEEI